MDKRNYEENNFGIPHAEITQIIFLIFLNPQKYTLFSQTAKELTQLLRKNLCNAEVELQLCPNYRFGAIIAELDMLSIDEPSSFSEILSTADTFEIYPLTNGNVKLEMTFHSVFEVKK